MDTRVLARLCGFTGSFLLLCLSLVPPVHAMPPIQHWVTDNGVRVYIVPAQVLPMVDVKITFAAGSVRDGDHPGLASKASPQLAMGEAGLSADEVAERI